MFKPGKLIFGNWLMQKFTQRFPALANIVHQKFFFGNRPPHFFHPIIVKLSGTFSALFRKKFPVLKKLYFSWFQRTRLKCHRRCKMEVERLNGAIHGVWRSNGLKLEFAFTPELEEIEPIQWHIGAFLN